MNASDIIHSDSHTSDQVEIAEILFDHVPEIVFFVKDAVGRYLVVNQTLVLRCGKNKKTDLIGLRPAHVFGSDMGGHYEQQDRKVIRSGQPLIKHLELHNYPSQEMGWCLTTKVPLYDASGKCAGLVGISQDLNWSDLSEHFLKHVSEALKYAEENLHSNPSIAEIAQSVNLSTYQLDRRMKMLFGISTGKWLLKTKISKASQKLLATNFSILDIAYSVGYNDQSSFTRQFKTATGLTPTEFKKHNINNAA